MISNGYIERQISDKIKGSFKKFPVVTLTGPRQAGKSTMLQKIFPELPYVNFESINTLTLAKSDPEGFVSEYKNGAIFDEIQKVPEIFSAIQVAVDKSKKSSLFILSGSQNFLLMEKVSQTLAGRAAIFHLLSFSQQELGKHSRQTLNEKMFFGGYPPIFDRKISPQDWLDGYVQTFIERDIRSLKNVKDLDQFRTFVLMCAHRSGQILDLTSLGNDCGISSHTAKSWLSLLETSFIVFTLKPFYKNFNKRLIKSPKLYFWDTGLLCFFLGIKDPQQLNFHSHLGNIFETYILSEIRKSFLNAQRKASIHFWHDKVCEVDLLIDVEFDKPLAIEIKAGKTYNNDYRKSLDYWQKISKSSLPKYIIYGGQEEQNLDRNIKLISALKLDEFLQIL